MKLFTVEEANSLLPGVRRVVKSIQRAHRRVLSFRDAAREAARGAEFGGGGTNLGNQYARVLTELSLKVNQLEGMGIQLKDYERGLIDFPSMREGRVVLLCWQADEGNQLEWWHDLETGFAGRQPL
jgi:hypothetical protein